HEIKSESEPADSLSIEPDPKAKNYQLSFFQLNDPVLENIKEELLKTEINALTPVEALLKLNEIKKMVST
ncbi:MAG: hypothetical protein ACK452_13385, partial [Bacteroidota bacterium]